MSWARLRRDPAIQALPGYSPLALVLGGLIWGMLERTPIDLGVVPYATRTEGVYQMLILVWSLPLGLLIAGKFYRRCGNRLDLILPLSPRRLWAVRAIAVILAGMALLSIAAGAIVAGNLLTGSRPLLQPGLVSFGCHLAVGLILTLAILQSPSPSLWSIPASVGYVGLSVVSMAGYLALTVVLSSLPRVYAVVPLGVALILGIRIYRRLPLSFVLAGRVEGSGDRAAGSEAARMAAGRSITGDRAVEWSVNRLGRARWLWLLNSTVFRGNLGNLTWLYLPVFALHGVVLSDCGHSTHFAFYFLGTVLLAAWTMVSLDGLYRIDPLPLTRGRVFAVVVFSSLLALAGGYGLGAAGRVVFAKTDPQVDYRPGPGRYRIKVPPERWEIAHEDAVPSISTPGGTTAEPEAYHLFRGGDLMVYNPYSAPVGSSPRLVAVQLSRAVQAVYGATIPPSEIQARYFATATDGEARLSKGRFSLLRDYPGLERSGGGRAFPLVVVAVVLPWLVFTSLVYRGFRGCRKENSGRAVITGIFALLILMGMGSMAANAVGLLNLWALSRAAGILVRQVGENLPGGALGVWLLSALVLAAGYVAALQQFQRVEAPVKRKGR